MKRTYTFLLAAVIAATAMAIPARRGFRTVTNSDGTTMTISLVGDETFHYHVNTDGVPVRQNDNGDWVVDTRDVTTLWTQASARRNMHRAQIAKKMRRNKAPLRAGVSASATGTKKGLLILVEFTDTKFYNSDSKTKQIFTQMLNGLNNPYGKNYGSVREYFQAQSYGQLDIEFDIAGPVTVSRNMAYYGGNDSNGDDKAPGKMVAEAVDRVDAQINFKDYDWDGDGEVENIYITYAGYGEAIDGADPNTIWPHQWQLSDPDCYGIALNKDGVTIDTYACGSELMGLPSDRPTIDGIGTMCHEYSHCLGLPDFYDTRSQGSNFGMNSWSLMDYGCYNGNGFTPAGYTAYERWFSGWLEPVELNEAANIIDMPNIEQNPVAYIVYNDANHNEYYLLENHQRLEWDTAAKGHGLLVVHVDYDENAWYNNTVNNTTSRQRMTIIPADNKLTTSTISGDPFPQPSNKNCLTDTSSPAATLYRANSDGSKLMHKPIENISEANGKISFSFMGGAAAIEAPVAEEDVAKLDVTANGFTAKWESVEGAASYNLRLTEKDEEYADYERVLNAINIIEDFEAFFVDESKTSDGSSDLSASLDNYTADPGWQGQKVYQGLYGAKLGTSTALGYLISPVGQCTTGELTAYVEAWQWFNYATYSDTENYKPDGSSVEVSLLDESGKVLQTQTVLASDLMEENYLPVFHFSSVPAKFRIKLSSTAGKKRLYVSYVICFDGSFTDDEVDTIWETEDGEEAPQRSIQLKTKHKAPRRVPGDTQTLTDITATSYRFNGLTPGATYTWQVQAVAEDGSLSGWSKLVRVTLPENGEDAIGSVLINNDQQTTKTDEVFDLAGRRMNKQLSQLRRGAYVIGGKKVIVK